MSGNAERNMRPLHYFENVPKQSRPVARNWAAEVSSLEDMWIERRKPTPGPQISGCLHVRAAEDPQSGVHVARVHETGRLVDVDAPHLRRVA
jgi:hypothetical protein